MQPEIADRLLQLNQVFYDRFGGAFAATRRRIQPGVRRALASLPDHGDWLDLGCGSAWLGVEWLRAGRVSTYLGMDSSAPLLDEARQSIAAAFPDQQKQVQFIQGNLADPDWPARLSTHPFTGVLCFAALHHLPGHNLHQRVARQVAALLPPGARFIHSNWQFQNSPRLLERVQPWDAMGLSADQVEPGDALLDWRYTLPGQPEEAGLRYVHVFSPAELASLAEESGFRVVDVYHSDGEGNRLSLYSVWEKQEAPAHR